MKQVEYNSWQGIARLVLLFALLLGFLPGIALSDDYPAVGTTLIVVSLGFHLLFWPLIIFWKGPEPSSEAQKESTGNSGSGSVDNEKSGIDLSRLTLDKQGGCGYLVDRDKVIRALWVQSFEDAALQLNMTLQLHKARGRIGDVPDFVFGALTEGRFLHAVNTGFQGVGGYIIMFDRQMLPHCGRLLK